MAKLARFLTTVQAARLCYVTTRTVAKWTDLGLLPFWTMPGSNRRRIDAAVLLKFLQENGVPITAELRALAEKR